MAGASRKPATKSTARMSIKAGMPVRWSSSKNGEWHAAFCRRVNGDGTISCMVFPAGAGVSMGGYDAARHVDSGDEYVQGMPFYGYWDFTEHDKNIAEQLNELAETVTK